MKKKEVVVEKVKEKDITSKDVINFVSSLIGVIIFAKKVYDYYKK